MPLGIGFQPPSGGLDRHFLPDAGDDVLQLPAFGGVIQHVVDRQQRHAGSRQRWFSAFPGGGGHRRDRAWRRQARPLPRRCFSVFSSVRGVSSPGRCGGTSASSRPSACSAKSSKERWHSPFLATQLALGQNAAEPAIGLAIAGISQDVGRAVDENKPRADQELRLFPRQFGFIERGMSAHHAGKRVAVGDPDRVEPVQARRHRPVLPARRPRAGTRNWW